MPTGGAAAGPTAARRLRDARDPRRPGPRPGHRCGGHADQPRDDVRARTRWASTPGYEYSRTGNPTRRALEECVASLEGAAHGLAFASGHGRRGHRPARLLAPGDHVVIPDDAYGGTYRLVAKVFAPRRDRVERRRPHRPGARSTPPGATRPALVWVETPTNPMLTIVDIAAVARDRARSGARGSSSTTRSPRPYLQRPLALGADVVVHSSTKYLGGHSDVVGGFVAVTDDALGDAARVRAERGRRGAVAVRLLPRAARRQDARRSAWTATARTPAPSSRCCSSTPRSSACCTRACPSTPATTSRRARCATSAAW